MLVRIFVNLLLVVAWLPLDAHAQATSARDADKFNGRLEIGVGFQFADPAGEFDDVADLGVGGFVRVGYWLTSRWSVGASYSGYYFFPPDFLGNIDFYSEAFDDLGWNVNRVGIDTQVQLLRFLRQGGGEHGLYVTAKADWDRATFTADVKNEITADPRVDIELSDDGFGFSGGLGYRLVGPVRPSTVLRRVSVTLELLYCHVGAEPIPSDIDFLTARAGLSFHFGSSPPQ